MKLNLVNVLMLSGGAIFLYSGVKGYDPRDVLRWGLGGKKPKKMKSADSDGDWQDRLGPNEDNPDPGQRYPGDLGVPDPDDKDNVPATYPRTTV